MHSTALRILTTPRCINGRLYLSEKEVHLFKKIEEGKVEEFKNKFAGGLRPSRGCHRSNQSYSGCKAQGSWWEEGCIATYRKSKRAKDARDAGT